MVLLTETIIIKYEANKYSIKYYLQATIINLIII